MCSACIVIPTPQFDSGTARANLNKKSPAGIEPGVSTRQDVLLAFGEPDAVSPDERKLAYRSEKIIGIWIAGGGYSAASGTFTKDRYLVVEFDGKGFVKSREISSRWFVPSAPGSVHWHSGRTGGLTSRELLLHRNPASSSCRLMGWPHLLSATSAPMRWSMS